MIGNLTFSIATRPALRQPGHLARSTSASCRQRTRRNAPLVTMCEGSVHLFPHRSTVARGTAKKTLCASRYGNQGWDCSRVTRIVYPSSAFTPTLSRRRAQFRLHAL